MTDQTQLQQLAKRIPANLITDNGRGMDAMDHTVITQYLLGIVGPYSFRVTEVIKDYPKPSKKNPEPVSVVTGVIGELTVQIDGREVTIAEPGGVEKSATLTVEAKEQSTLRRIRSSVAPCVLDSGFTCGHRMPTSWTKRWHRAA